MTVRTYAQLNTEFDDVDNNWTSQTERIDAIVATGKDIVDTLQSAISNVWQYGGNTVGGVGSIGTNDAFALNIKTNNIPRITIASTGEIQFNSAYAFPTADGTAGQILVTDGVGALTYQDQPGTVAIAVWKFKTPTTDADPGTGAFRRNNALASATTFLYVDNVADSGANFSTIILGLKSGDMIQMNDKGNATKYENYTLTGNPIAATGYVKIPVVNDGFGSTPIANDNKISFVFFFSGSSPSGEVNTASNLGTGGTGLFASKVGVDLQFKQLKSANSDITLSSNATDAIITHAPLTTIDVSATYNATVDDDFIRVTGNRSIVLPNSTTARKPIAVRSLTGTATITVASSGTVDGSANTTITVAHGKIFYPAQSSNRWDTLAQF